MSRKWLWLPAVIAAVLAMSAGAEDKSPTKKPERPRIFYWYLGAAPTVGREIWRFHLSLGGQTVLSVQALGADKQDTHACPSGFRYDKSLIEISPVPEKCNAVKVKGLKQSSELFLRAVFQLGDGDSVMASIPGVVGAGN